MHTSQSWLVMLSLNDSGLVFFVHTFDRLSGIALEILIAWLDWVFDVNNLLLSKVFQVHILCTADFFLIFMNFYLHLVDETHSDWVEKLRTEPVFYVGQYDEEKCTTTPEFTVFCLKFLFFSCAYHCIEKSPQSGDKFLMRVVCAPFVLLFLAFLLYLKQVVLWTQLLMPVLIFSVRNVIR